MQNTDWSFWGDGADLWIHSRLERIKKLLALFLSLGLTAIGVYGLGKFVFPDGAWGIISGLASLLAALSLFCADLYFKGEKAGNTLKATADRLQAAAENSAERIKAVKTLTQARDDLQDIATFGQQHTPRAGPQVDLHTAMVEFVARLKMDVKKCIEECDRRTAGVPGMSLGTEQLDDLMMPHQVIEYVRRKLGLIDEFLGTLKQSAFSAHS